MSARFVFKITKSGLLRSSVFVNNSKKYAVMSSLTVIRGLSALEVNKNISLIGDNDVRHLKIDKQSFKLERTIDKPLVVMLSWLMAKKKHIFKYADIYVNEGFDVLNVTVSPWQLLWPAKGTQVVAANILKFLDNNRSFAPIILHGFSVGGYVWSEAMVQMASEKDKYQNVINRIEGQIWDSAADVTEIPIGVPIAVFPSSAVMQNTLRQYLIYHLKAFDKVATCHYVRASQMFHTNLVKAPALFFISKSDPIGSERANRRAKDNWENMGMEVFWKCWDKSPHVGHFRHYPEEYRQELINFVRKIMKPQESQKLQAKL